MVGFKEWLADEGARLAGEGGRRQRVKDWIGSIRHLYSLIQGWLAEDDPNGLLKISQGTIPIDEERLGVYEAPTLGISFFDRGVMLLPRNSGVLQGPGFDRLGLRVHGLVEMAKGGDKFRLYLTSSPDGRGWHIADWKDEFPRPLDKGTFEDALRELLS